MNTYNAKGYAVTIDGVLTGDEYVLWRGKPKKSAYIWKIIAKWTKEIGMWLLLAVCFAVMTYFFDVSLLGILLVGATLMYVLVLVCLWIPKVIGAFRQWKNSEYAITNKRVILRNGLKGYEFKSIYYMEIANVLLQAGKTERIFKVANINILLDIKQNKSNIIPTEMLCIEDAQDVHSLLNRTFLKMRDDVQYKEKIASEKDPNRISEYTTGYVPYE